MYQLFVSHLLAGVLGAGVLRFAEILDQRFGEFRHSKKVLGLCIRTAAAFPSIAMPSGGHRTGGSGGSVQPARTRALPMGPKGLCRAPCRADIGP